MRMMMRMMVGDWTGRDCGVEWCSVVCWEMEMGNV
jgi:hypothetical protein